MAKPKRHRRKRQARVQRMLRRKVGQCLIKVPSPVVPASRPPMTEVERLNAKVDPILADGGHDRAWYIVRTSPSAERRALRGLVECNFAAYLPCELGWRWSRGHKHRTERPVFVGYLFVGISAHQSVYELREVSGVEGLVAPSGQPRQIKPAVVVKLREADLAGDFDKTGPRKPIYAKDQEVQIRRGLFAGQIGRVIELKGEDRLRVLLEGSHIYGEHQFSNDDVEPVSPTGEAA